MSEFLHHTLLLPTRFRNLLVILLLVGWFSPALAVVTCTAPNTNGPAKPGFGSYRFGGGNCSPYVASWVYGTCTWTWNNASVWDASCNSDTVPNVGDDVVIGTDSILTMDANRTVRNFTNSGGGNRDAYLTLNNYTLTVKGNFTNNNYPEWNCGAFQLSWNSCSPGAICTDSCDGHGWTIFNGAAQQTIGGTSTATSFTNLEINNPAGVKLNHDVIITGQLKLTSGFIDVNGHKLKIYSDCATYPILGSGYVTDAADAIGGIAWLQLNFKSPGTETCVFPVGDPDGQGAITVTKYGSNTGTLMGGSSSVIPLLGAGLTSWIDTANNANHLWTLTPGASESYWNVASPNASTNVVSKVAVSGLSTATTYDVTFQFCAIRGSCTALEKNGIDNYNVPHFIMVQDKTMANGAAFWTRYLNPNNSPTESTSRQTGVTGFGWFGVGVPPQTLHHVRLSITDGNAAICSAKDITVSMCANATCTPYFPAVSVKLKTPTASAGAAPTWSTNPVATAAYGSGTALTYLSDLTSGAVVSLLTSYTSITVAPTVTTIECWNSTSNSAISCASALTYSGCTFDAVEADNALGTNLNTKVAGISPASGFDVWATMGSAPVTKNTTYTGSPTIELVDDTTGSNCATRTALSGVTFSPALPAAFVGGKLTVAPTSANPAKKVRVRVTSGGSSSCSTDSFTIRPATLALAATAIDPGGVAVAGTSAMPNGTLGLYKTGMTITATAKNGAATPLTATSYTGTPALSPGMTITDSNSTNISPFPNPSTSPPSPATTARTLSWVSGTGFTAAGTSTPGVSTGTFYYNDFGTLTFPADAVIDNTYTGASTSNDQANVDCISGASPASTSNSPVGGKYGCHVGSATLTSPRFKPDHYEAHLLITPTCPGGTNPFSYMGDPNLSVTVDLKAANADGGQMTRMWSDSSPTPPTITVTADNGGSGIALNALNSFALPNPPAWKAKASGYDGGFYSAFDSTATTSLAFTTPFYRPTAAAIGPYESFQLTMTLTDTDGGKISVRNGANIAAATSVTTPTTYRFRYGMLKFDNVYGSELLPLSIPVKTMYRNGSVWQQNTDDTCTTLDSHALVFSNFKSGLVSVSAPVTTFSAGQGTIKITATGNNIGSADVAMNLGTTAPDASCNSIHPGSFAGNYTNGANMPWLRGNWCGGSTFANDPSARVTFGSAKSLFLFRREKY